MRVTSNRRGTIRNRYIGDGKLRELMVEASRKERKNDLLGAIEDWEEALRNINPERQYSLAHEDYINRRLNYCRTWGLRMMAQQKKDKQNAKHHH